jgi:hypothetical protein
MGLKKLGYDVLSGNTQGWVCPQVFLMLDPRFKNLCLVSSFIGCELVVFLLLKNI